MSSDSLLRIPVPKILPPIKLRRATELLVRRHSGENGGFNEQERSQRRHRLLQKLRTSRAAPRELQRRDRSVLIDIALGNEGEDDESADQIKERAWSWLIELRELLGWRQLMWLWSHRLEHDLSEILEERLRKRLEMQPSFADRIPSWMLRPGSTIEQALGRPKTYISVSMVQGRVPLPSFESHTQLNISSKIAQQVLPDLIRRGKVEWWRAQDAAVARDWATELPLPIRSALAERQILDLNSSRETEKADKDHLLRWLDRRFKHPDDHPENWVYIAEEAQDIVRRARLAEVIDDILNEFGRGAERDRHQFWLKHSSDIQDAAYYQADIAVCLMVIGENLFVEFGQNGNACYVYRRPQGWLRRLMRGERRAHREFKSETRLVLGGEALAHVQRLLHNSDWQSKFEAAFGRRGKRNG